MDFINSLFSSNSENKKFNRPWELLVLNQKAKLSVFDEISYDESIKIVLIHFDSPLTKSQFLVCVTFITPSVLCYLSLIKAWWTLFNPILVIKIVLLSFEIAELNKSPSTIKPYLNL